MGVKEAIHIKLNIIFEQRWWTEIFPIRHSQHIPSLPLSTTEAFTPFDSILGLATMWPSRQRGHKSESRSVNDRADHPDHYHANGPQGLFSEVKTPVGEERRKIIKNLTTKVSKNLTRTLPRTWPSPVVYEIQTWTNILFRLGLFIL